MKKKNVLKCLSAVVLVMQKYRHRLSATKNDKHRYWPQKNLLVNLYHIALLLQVVPKRITMSQKHRLQRNSCF